MPVSAQKHCDDATFTNLSYYTAIKERIGVPVLFLLRKLYRKTILGSGLVGAFFILNALPASATGSVERLTYHAALGRDLDGDGIAETATIRQSGTAYKITIQFTSGTPRLNLTVYQPEGETGLTLLTSDVNDDRKADLVITSGASARPVAIWLNRGKAKFQKVNSWIYSVLGKMRGPALRQKPPPYDPEAALNSPTDPPAQAVKLAQLFGTYQDTENLGPLNSERLRIDAVLRQVPARGPPASNPR